MTVWLGDVAATARDAMYLSSVKNAEYPSRSLLAPELVGRKINVPLFVKPDDQGYHSALKYWNKIEFSGTFSDYSLVVPVIRPK